MKDNLSAQMLASKIRNGDKINLVDCRRPSEFATKHVDKAVSLPLDYINQNMDKMKPSIEYHIYCASGYRSAIMASILKSRGYIKVVNIAGGFNDLKNTDVATQSGVLAS